jgi:hypothetical protein
MSKQYANFIDLVGLCFVNWKADFFSRTDFFFFSGLESDKFRVVCVSSDSLYLLSNNFRINDVKSVVD